MSFFGLLPRLALAGLALVAVLSGCAQRSLAPKPLMQTQTAAATSEQAKPVANIVGRDLFVERCASCHNERGDKPLRTGLPLNQRKLSRETITSAVQGRLRSKTAAEQQAVVEYISSLYVGANQK
jgi:mono/diheme cytochrome c family protein